MKIELSQYLNLPYQFQNGPSLNSEVLLTQGLNCQAFVHLVYQIIGKPLPKTMLSQEIYQDTTLFTFISSNAELLFPDIILFGPKKLQDLRKLHLAISIGTYDQENNPLFIHANHIDKCVSVWPLAKFFDFSQYQIIWAIKRYMH